MTVTNRSSNDPEMRRASTFGVLAAVVASTIAGVCGGAIMRAALTSPSLSAQSAPVRALPEIPPVASPPLYPDSPTTVMHWTREEMDKLYTARQTASRAGGAAGNPGTTFRGQSFRTHTIGSVFRVKFTEPRVSNRAGILSSVDDADQHEGVTDFYVFTGGNGQIITDGRIENRVYGSNPRSAAANGVPYQVVYGGEFNGQPIVDGKTNEIGRGDWLAIPPNVPHWPGYNPGDGLQYIMLKVNLGFYPPNLMY
jgi:hypothetical protein